MERELEITALVHRGYGLARREGKVWFVPFTAPGDRILARAEEEKKNLVYGRMTALLEPGEGRVRPPCPYFGRCGGCHYQHLDYPRQLKAKEDILTNFFSTLKAPPPVRVEGAPRIWNYRSRIRLHRDSAGGPEAGWGFYAASERGRQGGLEVVPIEACLLAGDSLNAALKTQGPPGSAFWDLGESAAPENRETGLPPEQEVPFSQVHPEVNRLLRGEILRQAGALEAGQEKAGLNVGDLYCGAGNLSLPLAQAQTQTGQAVRIRGWDSCAPAIRKARTAAEAFPETDIRYFCRPIESSFKEIQKELGPGRDTRLLILDPPRRGLKETAPLIVSLKIPVLFYVSCSPPDMIRDLKFFEAAGYRVTQGILLDMFPQTYHIECLSILRADL
jgi:tRNA/tmRNA/rRNA uracil-C5-methylase (TrmA/RlmC/RlmD family)